MTVTTCALPDDALLQKYRLAPSSDTGTTYTDCYQTRILGSVALGDYVFAFYTTWLFGLERWILLHLLRKSSTDDAARELADGLITEFAAWHVEARTSTQLLMCDFQGRTRSWFMVEPVSGNGGSFTVLRFGSAVVPAVSRDRDEARTGRAYRMLLPFHRAYSRLLLRAALTRLHRTTK
jgi:hypothetical protein